MFSEKGILEDYRDMFLYKREMEPGSLASGSAAPRPKYFEVINVSVEQPRGNLN